jgi:hypothetical protein
MRPDLDHLIVRARGKRTISVGASSRELRLQQSVHQGHAILGSNDDEGTR